MRKQTLVRTSLIAFILGLLVIPGFVMCAQAAPTYVSPNYGVDEVFFGAGGVNDATSASYRARASLGDTGVGNSSSSLYQLYGGFTTTEAPFLEFVVNSANVDLGVQNTASASTGTATFTIKAYLASGYVVTTISDPPKNASYTITNMATTAASAPGTEQFGINLRANTSPTTVGADPVQLPDASFSFGQVSADYNTVNQFKYVKNDVIAYSNKSSGITQFTMTYLMNIKSTTPGGTYVMDHNLVATGTF